MPLLDWLQRCALPEEIKLADQSYSTVVADEFLHGLVSSGTTSALVFGSHFATAMDALFSAAVASGLRITSGQVLSPSQSLDRQVKTGDVLEVQPVLVAG